MWSKLRQQTAYPYPLLHLNPRGQLCVPQLMASSLRRFGIPEPHGLLAMFKSMQKLHNIRRTEKKNSVSIINLIVLFFFCRVINDR